MVAKKRVLVVLANDAKKDHFRHRYTDIGPNAKVRHDFALEWRQEKLPTAPVLWSFGAGTDLGWHGGPTLASLSESYVRLKLPDAQVLVNRKDHNSYGTLEEMKWVVDRQYYPHEVRFVFFAPAWHLRRAKLIWLLFFQKEWGSADFVPTPDEAEFKLGHEVKAWSRIVLVKGGLIKGRDETPYPALKVVGHSEC